MAKISEGTFQSAVAEYLIRHRSILDVQSKLAEAVARVNRAVAKSVTNCGCIRIQAGRQCFPSDVSMAELRNAMQTHLDGAMCERCREVLETEIGMALFYLAATCNLLDLDFGEILRKEHGRAVSLGVFRLT
ncbi:MAG: DUF1573 domain-containing protein [Armatimonadetes bacterium]|nr:DUF1573 domain-containing protein [Armatimonadota bacterium]